jgi:DNA-binding NarL/FixJ family response regulator
VAVVVVGQPALTCDVLARAVAEVAPADAADDVVVLVNPNDDHWDRARELSARIVLMDHRVAHSGDDTVAAAVMAGADAVVDGDVSLGELRATVERVSAGGTVLSVRQTRAVVDSARGDRERPAAPQLTRREREILECIEAGRSVKQTARHLGIADKTVENVRSRLFRKLGARNGGHALVSAAALGVLTTAD